MIPPLWISMQKDLCHKYGVEWVPTSMNLMIGISNSVRDGKMPINGERHNEEGTLSGWFVWAGENFSEDPDFYKPHHASHIDDICPLVIKYLGLPPGWRFQIDNNGYEDVWEDKKLLEK